MLYVVWIIIALFICYSVNDELIVRKYKLNSSKINEEIKIVQLSDFHNHNAYNVIKHLKQIKFDIVVITGDLIDPRYDVIQVEILLNYLKDYQTYFISGNHEMKKTDRFKDIEKLYAYLNSFNVKVVDNENIDITLNNNLVTLVGIRDNTYFDKTSRIAREIAQVNKQCEMLKGNYNLVLMHRPEKYELFLPYDCDLILSGHAHGGQVRIGNLVNGLYAPNQGILPKRAGGKYQNGKLVHIVSRGMARYWMLPRIFNHCEIVLVVINKG